MLYPLATATREQTTLDGLWAVAFDPRRGGLRRGFPRRPPAGVRTLAVPASLNEQVTEPALYHHMDWVWYFRDFVVPASWTGRRVFLRFGAATYRAEVFLDGRRLGDHEGGYTPFEFELTGIARPGQTHRLAVRLDNLLDATTIPQGNLPPEVGGVAAWRVGNHPNVHYDFFPFMGLHRPVVLYATGASRFETVRVTTRSLRPTSADAEAVLAWSGPADELEISVPELRLRKVVPLRRGQRRVIVPFTARGLTPWSPEHPRLYDVELRLRRGDATLDHYVLPFGFRTVRVRGPRLLLNGRPVFLRGFGGRHEDIPIIGKGLSLPHLVKDNALLKWIGANSFRTAHYPYAEETLRLADREGFLVISEVAANTLSMKAVKAPAARARLAAAHRQQMTELLARDHNHPSVIVWSLGNECETYVPETGSYFRRLVRQARRLDDSRPILFVINSWPDTERTADAFDLIAVNTYPAWYWDCGKLDRIEASMRRLLNGFWRRYRKPILVSEFGADALPGQHSEHELMWTEEYQVEMLRRVIACARARPYVCGTHVWTFADFRVGQHVGRVINNWKGVFTRDRQPKMAAHLLRRLWTESRTP